MPVSKQLILVNSKPQERDNNKMTSPDKSEDAVGFGLMALSLKPNRLFGQ